MIKIGAITVGQSPRTDLTPEMLPILGDSISLIQMGGLDGLTRERNRGLRSGRRRSRAVSRLTDGSSVTFGESHILSRLQDCIDALENDGVSMIVFFMHRRISGELPLKSSVNLSEPDPDCHGACRLSRLPAGSADTVAGTDLPDDGKMVAGHEPRFRGCRLPL